MKASLTRDDLVALLLQMSDEMAAAKERLCELDAAAGDGDLGITVALGFGAIQKALGRGEGLATLEEVLKTCGAAFADNAASTFGALMATMFQRAGRVLKGCDAIGPSEAARMLQAAAEGVQQRGKAQLGDKTLLDALIPAARAATQAAAEGKNLVDCMERALEAAREGASQTAGMRARAGRAAWLGDRTLNAPDPGATAIVLLLESATRYLGS